MKLERATPGGRQANTFARPPLAPFSSRVLTACLLLCVVVVVDQSSRPAVTASVPSPFAPSSILPGFPARVAAAV